MAERPLEMYPSHDGTRAPLPHPTAKFAKGAVVRCTSIDPRCGASYGEEFKIRAYDHYTNQFGVWGKGREAWFQTKDFEVLIGKTKPTAADDFELRIAELERQKADLELKAAAKRAAAEADAASKAEGDGYADAPPVAKPVGVKRNPRPIQPAPVAESMGTGEPEAK